MLPVYLALQPISRAAHCVATVPGGLLPRLFTLAALAKDIGGCFLSRCSTVADSSPLENMVLYVARTFLPPLIRRQATKRTSGPRHSGCKVTKILRKDEKWECMRRLVAYLHFPTGCSLRVIFITVVRSRLRHIASSKCCMCAGRKRRHSNRSASIFSALSVTISARPTAMAE